MPPLDGATAWLNTKPLTVDALRGSAVVVNFWTLTCINWLRTEPYVRAWADTYKKDSLVVIGVHTPEFSFEQDVAAVQQAIKDRGIHYPVAVDSNYAIWNAFANHYWPALYFVNKNGVIRDEHFGEGRYEESEHVIQQLLGVERKPVVVTGANIEAEADWPSLRTPETYLGYARGQNFASPENALIDQPLTYTAPAQLARNHWACTGTWTIDAERAVLASPGGSIAFRFHARDAHLVLSPGSHKPIPFRVLLNDKAPGRAHGADIDEHGAGLLQYGRLYQLIRQQGVVQDATLTITFAEPGAEAYAFTFG